MADVEEVRGEHSNGEQVVAFEGDSTGTSLIGGDGAEADVTGNNRPGIEGEASEDQQDTQDQEFGTVADPIASAEAASRPTTSVLASFKNRKKSTKKIGLLRILLFPASLALLLLVHAAQLNPSEAFLHTPRTNLPSISFGSPPSQIQHVRGISLPDNNAWRHGRRYTVATYEKSAKNGMIVHNSSNNNSLLDTGDLFFDGRTTAALVGGQSLLIVGSIVAAYLVGTPNYGLGPGFALTWSAVAMGVFLTIPLGVLAAALDLVEDRFPALQDVTTATQRSVLSLLGGKFKPGIALITSLALGCVAGVGEEMLFRGVLQFELQSRFGQAIAIGLSSFIFGALHAVTPLYAFLAALASVYFGGIYIWSANLAVPIAAHAFYDLVALLFAHYTVSKLDTEEQEALFKWRGPGDA